jgi:CDP-glucose 4,6-dehydratase
MTWTEDPWASTPVLVTGHTGFKGSWLCLWLARLGARVSGLALAPPERPNLFEAARVADGLDADHRVDVRDGAGVVRAVAEAGPTVVFHLAAQSLVREGHRRPVDTFATNVVGTATVLEAVRLLDRPCAVVVVTSDKCYENLDGGWMREIDPLGGADPYGASKAGAELVTAAYRRTFFGHRSSGPTGVLAASARAGNVIGGGDWSTDRIVPDAIRALAADQPVPVRNPGAVRPWQHVLEPLSGYLLLAERLLAADPRAADAWNFGPAASAHVEVASLVEGLCRAWGGGGWERRSGVDDAPEAPALRLCTDKAEVELGWRPRWDLDCALGRTVAWYRDFHRGEADPQEMCHADISAYEAARAT